MVNVGKYSKYSSPIRHIWERKTQTCHFGPKHLPKNLSKTSSIHSNLLWFNWGPHCIGSFSPYKYIYIYMYIYIELTSHWMVNYVATLHGTFNKKRKEIPNIHCVFDEMLRMMFLFKTNCNTQCMVKDLRPGKMYGYPYMDVWSGSQEICSHFQAGNFPKDAFPKKMHSL